MIGEFYHHIPKDPKANMRFRREIIKWGFESKRNAAELREMCKRDILFFLNVFCWLLEPRKKKTLPFITRWYQDDGYKEIIKCTGDPNVDMDDQDDQCDLAFEKSREVGATWMALYFALWCCLFFRDVHIGLTSKNEDSVDNSKDPDSLMSKLDFALKKLPAFLRTGLGRTKLSMHFFENESSIIGYPATTDAGRSGRKFFWIMDELHAIEAPKDSAMMASTQYVTDCRFAIATPNGRRGQSGAYYDFVSNTETSVHKLTIRWQDDPAKWRGAYRTKGGELEIIDEEYFLDNPGYKFTTEEGVGAGRYFVEGGDRSVYYDKQTRRASATRQSVASELDLSFSGATWQLFSPEILNRCLEGGMQFGEFVPKTAMPVVQYGMLHVSQDDGTLMDGTPDDPESPWTRNDTGYWSLWFEPDENGFPPPGQYTIGADIAVGTGSSQSSNSALVVFNERGEQVAEYACNSILVHRFAKLAAGACYWFRDSEGTPAQLAPEIGGGSNANFMVVLAEIGFSYIYRREVKDTIGKKKQQKFGIVNTDRGETILIEMQMAMDTGKCKIRSAKLLAECGHYIRGEGEQIIHALSKDTDDLSARGKSHGDRAIAGACGWKARKALMFETRKKPKQKRVEFELDHLMEIVEADKRQHRESVYHF